jgi:serine/threonine protein kinase
MFLIVHRDIKPPNILVDKVNDKLIIKIADFGISRNLLKNTVTIIDVTVRGTKTIQYACLK